MLEEIRFYLQQTPGLTLVLGILGVFCLLLILVPLTRTLRRNLGQGFLEIPVIKRTGEWFGRNPETIPLAIGILCLLGTGALLANPVRLLLHGKGADGVVTSVVESRYEDSDHKTKIRSTATIRFSAGDRTLEIQSSTSREPGSWCIAGCYRRGDRLKILYLEEDPSGAKVHSFFGLFSGPLMAGMAAALAFLFWWVMKPERTAAKPVA